mgnify:CR=1 FL=1
MNVGDLVLFVFAHKSRLVQPSYHIGIVIDIGFVGGP